MEQQGLDEILNASDPGDENPVVETSEPIVDPPSGIADRPRDENGRWVKQDEGEKPAEEKPAEVASPAPEQSTIPESALLGERRRRQEAEQRAAQLEAQIQAFQRQQPQEMPPDFWENPNQVISSQVNQAVSSALQQWEQRQMQIQADRAEAAARAKYPDYDDAFAKFREQVSLDPGLVEQLHSSENPAEFAYRRGKQAIELSQVGDLDALKAKIEAETRAKVEAELLGANRQSLPITTAGNRSVAGRGGPDYAGPSSLQDILARR